MLARFFYGWGQEIHWFDRPENEVAPVSETEWERIEEFLRNIGAKMGFYQIEGASIPSIILLKDCSRKDEGEYEEWCPHCGGCTLYDYGDKTVMCMWCGEDLFPCDACRGFNKEENKCEWDDDTNSCRFFKHRNRVPNFK